MTEQEKQELRKEGYKQAMAVLRRMALERRRPDFWTALDWLGTQGRARFRDFHGEGS